MSHNDLANIHLHLKDVLKQLSKTAITTEFCDSSLKKDMTELENIIATNEINDQCKTLIGMIYKTAESISHVMNIRTNLPLAPTVTQTKSKRLPKPVVDILTSWYEENIDYPYLTKDDIAEINKKTGLSENQIKNWASNRRRKKRHDYISPELIQLLQ